VPAFQIKSVLGPLRLEEGEDEATAGGEDRVGTLSVGRRGAMEDKRRVEAGKKTWREECRRAGNGWAGTEEHGGETRKGGARGEHLIWREMGGGWAEDGRRTREQGRTGVGSFHNSRLSA
jgi:hypothetical protein